VRVEALVLSAVSAAVWRYLRARYRWLPDRAQPVPGPARTAPGTRR
jgi:hypothetical protein